MTMNPFHYDYEWAAIVAFVAASVALYGSWRANKIAERNLALAAEMEIIKFREKWIAELRDCLVDFLSFTTSKQVEWEDIHSDGFSAEHFSNQDWEKTNQVFSRILLLMNPNDEKYHDLRNCRTAELEAMFSGEARSSEFLEIAQSILKREWERLKQDTERLKVKSNAKNK